ncbi:MAG: DEAD/DEAH box helicase [Bacilli bacterium]|nr:DEAD/DEAH box helicase [Bacilli bacterium]
MTFKQLNLHERLLRALDELGYETPTPIQSESIPHLLNKKDLLGCAQTGTGKTAAFALPILNFLLDDEANYRKTRVLVLSPTRELAIQIRDNFRDYGKYTHFKCSVILGGVNQKSQIEVLKKGVDILVATPGRLLDLINQRKVDLSDVDFLVLDEADTMLDMGFIHDVRKIISHVKKDRQTMLFSATMPDAILNLVKEFMKDHVTVETTTVSSAAPKITQELYYVDKTNKVSLLIDILKKEDIKSTLVFMRTKHGANKLSDNLFRSGIKAEVIHGNKSQNARVLAFKNFKSGKSKVLIATDIAARGIDINELSHVVNFEMPDMAETYVHRIGRTGRAGLEGTAISFCDIDEKKGLSEIERLTKQELEVINHDYPMQNFILSPKKQQGRSFNKNTPNRRTSNVPKNKNYNRKGYVGSRPRGGQRSK